MTCQVIRPKNFDNISRYEFIRSSEFFLDLVALGFFFFSVTVSWVISLFLPFAIIESPVTFYSEAAQRFALPALGRGRRSRPTRKMIRRVKMLGMCAESPASGARFVRHGLLGRLIDILPLA